MVGEVSYVKGTAMQSSRWRAFFLSLTILPQWGCLFPAVKTKPPSPPEPEKVSAPLEWKEANRLKKHSDGVLAIAISRDGSTLASGSGDRSVVLWDLASGQS